MKRFLHSMTTLLGGGLVLSTAGMVSGLAIAADAVSGTAVATRGHNDLHLEFSTLNGVPQTVEVDLTNGASYSPSSRIYSASQDPAGGYPNVMCFGSGVGSFGLNLEDRSGYRRLFQGITSMSYDPTPLTHSVVSSGSLHCLQLPALIPIETLPDVDPLTFCSGAQSGEVGPEGTVGDLILFSGFEDGEGGGIPTGGNTDVRLAVDLIASPNPDVGAPTPLDYDLYAINCGTDDANGISIQDFVPIDNGTNLDPARFATTLDREICTISTGANCSLGRVQTTTGGDTPYILAQGIDLPGTLDPDNPEFARISVRRSTAAGNPGDVATLSFAVDAPDDSNLDDNVLTVGVTLISNLPPTFIFGQGNMMLDEDDPTGIVVTRDDPASEPNDPLDPPIPVEFSVDDPDGDQIASITVVEIDGLGAEMSPSDPGARLATLEIVSPFYGDPIPYPLDTEPNAAGAFQLQLTTNPDESGSTRIRVTATDSAGTPSIQDLDLLVREINDAPTFEIAYLSDRQMVQPTQSGGIEELVFPSEYCEAQGNGFLGPILTSCDQIYPLADVLDGAPAHTVFIKNWFQSRDEGADSDKEDGQSLELRQLDVQDVNYPGAAAEVLFDLKNNPPSQIELALFDDLGTPIDVANSLFFSYPSLIGDGAGNYDLLVEFRGIQGVNRLRMTVVDSGGTALGGTDVTEVEMRFEVVDAEPVPMDDNYLLKEDMTLNDNVMTNDVDPDTNDNSTLSVVSVTTVGGGTQAVGVNTLFTPDGVSGTVTISDTGLFSYQPGADDNGIATFQYDVSDGANAPVRATVTIDVDAVPDGFDKAFVIPEDPPSPLTGNVTTDGGMTDDLADMPSVIQLVSGPSNADSFSLGTDGSFSYEPELNFDASDSFQYQIVDVDGDISNTVTATITITPENDLPVITVATGFSVSNLGNHVILVTEIAATDVESADPDITINLVSGPNKGFMAFTADLGTPIMQFSMQDIVDGLVAYVHTTGSGTDSFLFNVVDGDGGMSTGNGGVLVTINP